MTLTLDEAIRHVERARTDDELFGGEPRRQYRRLAAALHPDRTVDAAPAQQRAATAAFVRLTSRWRARRRVRLGEYVLGEPAYLGDIADLYDVGHGRLLKLPRDPANNDLMARERAALRRIEQHGDPRYLPYVPRLVDAFRHRDTATGADRRINVVAAVPDLVPLTAIMRPEGRDPRDVAWMWRRLLVSLGLAHRAGVVHGAVLPEHVLIEPVEHGVVLADWCYAVTERDHTVPALVPSYLDWYPAEVGERRRPGPGTDIAMAARCMSALMGERVPRELRAFAGGCMMPALAQRPDDAWRLLGELDGVLEALYGPRTFRPFKP
jgi:hypothetical protein